MPDYEPIDYRLRCHTKRTDLPSDVLRDICEAYAEITRLQRKLANIKQGFEGSCTSCEPVGALNEQLADILTRTANALRGKPPEGHLHSWHDLPERVMQLIAERDEARREVCYAEAESRVYRAMTPREYAKRVGWDCFKENTDA